MRNTCLIIQPETMADIFAIAPIAKYYARKGLEVYWPVKDRYVNLVRKYFPYVYCSPFVDGLNNDFDIVVDTSDSGLVSMQKEDETFEEYKYRAAGLPFAFKNHLDWKRNREKESDLQAILEANYDIDFNNDHYVAAHVNDSFDVSVELPKGEVRRCVYVTEIEGFEIPDWYVVFAKAKAIYAVESAVHQFIDGAINRLKYDNDKLEFYLLSRSVPVPCERKTVSKHWNKNYY
jgi:hypothetical protein